MSAVGFTPIQLFRTTTASATPTALSLADGELAINLTDEKLYFKNAAGVVKLLASNSGSAGSVTSVDVSGGTTGLTTSGGPITSSGTITLAGTLGAANGGTGATTLSANGVLVGNGTSAVTAVVGTTGRVLTGNTGSAPSFEPITNLAVSSLSFGTTGLTPAGATTGAITVAGTLAVANGGTGVTTSTGTGSVVLNTSPTLVTPILGAASATSIANGLGAVGTPSYTFTGDTNTGMWSPSADAIAFSTDGSERVRVDASGNVGIAVTPSSQAFANLNSIQIRNTLVWGFSNNASIGANIYITSAGGLNYIASAASSYYAQESGQHLWYNAPSGTADNAISFTERMRIDTSGNLGIGTTSPASFGKLAVNGTTSLLTNGTLRLYNQANTNWGFIQNPSTDGNAFLIFANGGGEAMRLDASGNVGIGTSSPSQKLTVAVGDGAQAAQLRGATGYLRVRPYVDATSGAFIDATNAAENAYIPLSLAGSSIRLTTNAGLAATVDASGNVGIGLTNPGYRLHVNKGSAGIIANFTDGVAQTLLIGTSASGVTLTNDNSGFIAFANTAERARIDSSGNLLVGTTTAATTTQLGVVSIPDVAGGASAIVIGHANGVASGNSYAVFSYNGGIIGAITQNGTTDVLYTTASDARLKHDIVDAPDAASLIDAIKVRSFKWNIDDSEQRYGMIAQELVEVAPEAVSVPQDEDQMMCVDYSKLVPMLVKEIQSLRARVAQLEGN
jgi:hypothetical protein